MKQTIRLNVFETNSSSTHSITMCSKSEFDDWKDGKLYYKKCNGEFITPEEYKTAFNTYVEENYGADNEELDMDEVLEEFISDEGIVDYDTFFDDEYLEGYEDSYTTKSGETVIAFGHYGYDG